MSKFQYIISMIENLSLSFYTLNNVISKDSSIFAQKGFRTAKLRTFPQLPDFKFALKV